MPLLAAIGKKASFGCNGNVAFIHEFAAFQIQFVKKVSRRKKRREHISDSPMFLSVTHE